MFRLFGSVRQGVAAVSSAFLTVGSLALDASDTWSGVPWQLIAIGGFLAFALTVLWRIHQLRRPAVLIDVRWDRQQDDMKPLTANVANGRATLHATVTGRVWAVEPVTLDRMGVVFRASHWPWMPKRIAQILPKKDLCWGDLGDLWEEYNGAIVGRRMVAGDQIDLDRRLFSYWGEPVTGMKPGAEVYTVFRVAVRAPYQEVNKRISGKAD